MPKTRVQELANDLGVDSKEVISYLAGLGADVKNQSSLVDDRYADLARKRFAPTSGLTGANVQVVQPRPVGMPPRSRRAPRRVPAGTEQHVAPTPVAEPLSPAVASPSAVPTTSPVADIAKPAEKATEEVKQPAPKPTEQAATEQRPPETQTAATNIETKAPSAAQNPQGNGNRRPRQDRPSQGRPTSPRPANQRSAGEGTKPSGQRPAAAESPKPEGSGKPQNKPADSAKRQSRPPQGRPSGAAPSAPTHASATPNRGRNRDVSAEDHDGDFSNSRGPARRPAGGQPGRGLAPSGSNSGRPGANKNNARPTNKPGTRPGGGVGTGRPGAKPAAKRPATPAHKPAPPPPEEQGPKLIVIPDTISVADLAEQLAVPATTVIKTLMAEGVMAAINHVIEFDVAAMVGEKLGALVEHQKVEKDKLVSNVVDTEEELQTRPPVVTILGHVDHGKTTLLDAIRETRVVESEAGGITQHIGAYQVEKNNRKITFLDTPGHEAFTEMRSRGAQVTDMAVLVVAADDGVMPQTVEALNHAKAAQVPILVAINKIDRPGANPDRVKQQLTEHGLIAEEWGGDTVMVEVSALKKMGIEDLLEMILLVADMRELKANPARPGSGTVVEAELDKNRGPIATVLVQNGTLHTGDAIVAGSVAGRIRAMFDYTGKPVKSAGPSVPVVVLGLEEVPEAGDLVEAMADERSARDLAEKRASQKKAEAQKSGRLRLSELYSKIQEGEVKDLNIILKADVQGSVEALTASLERLSDEKVRVNVIHGAAGGITESDVQFAATSNAVIIGFNVRPDPVTRRAADREGVDIRLYRIIYEAIDDVKAAMSGLLEPTFTEVVLGRVEVRATFRVPNVGVIAGGYVTDGKILRNASVRVIRDSVVVFEGKIASLKRFKDDVREVQEGYECGIGIERYNDIKEGDAIEAFQMQEVKA